MFLSRLHLPGTNHHQPGASRLPGACHALVSEEIHSVQNVPKRLSQQIPGEIHTNIICYPCYPKYSISFIVHIPYLNTQTPYKYLDKSISLIFHIRTPNKKKKTPNPSHAQFHPGTSRLFAIFSMEGEMS